METLFVSDLHLSPERPEKLALFQELLRGRARFASAFYILGDLFEHFWVGNDDHTPPNPDILDELTNYANVNERLFIIRGNRDLMLDESFRTVSGCTVLPDGHVINLGEEDILISHGDVFCTRDVSYQRYRRFMEFGMTRQLFRWLPYFLRIRLSHGLKPVIQRSSEKKHADIVDVEQAAIELAMRKAGVSTLIHGHTHRPGMHEFDLDGKPAQRIVLPDWYEGDGLLLWENGVGKLMRIEEYLAL